MSMYMTCIHFQECQGLEKHGKVPKKPSLKRACRTVSRQND